MKNNFVEQPYLTCCNVLVQLSKEELNGRKEITYGMIKDLLNRNKKTKILYINKEKLNIGSKPHSLSKETNLNKQDN